MLTTDRSTHRVLHAWLVGAALGFIVLASLVAAGFRPLIAGDEVVARWISRTRPSWTETAFEYVSFAGSRWVIGPLLAVMVLWVVRSRRCRWIPGVLALAFLLNPLTEGFLKTLIDRPRPVAFQVRQHGSASFPSGHVLAAVAFYGVLAALVWKSTASRKARLASTGAAGTVIALVMASRIYLGAHWLSDVFGGLIVGSLYTGMVVMWFGDHHLSAAHSCFDGRQAPITAGGGHGLHSPR